MNGTPQRGANLVKRKPFSMQFTDVLPRWVGVIIHARAFDLIKGQSCSSFLFVEALLC